MNLNVPLSVKWLLKLFLNLLIIHQVKTKKITTMHEGGLDTPGPFLENPENTV